MPREGAEGADIQALQKSMMDDQEIMDLIQSLQQAPEMQELLKSPDIIKASQSGDISVLMSNPKFIRLLDNSKAKEIQKKLLTRYADRKRLIEKSEKSYHLSTTVVNGCDKLFGHVDGSTQDHSGGINKGLCI
jgi:hypothetical protein